jgi:sensor domain CHASE-containing protein
MQLKNMTLRKKILVAISLTFVCLIIFLYITSRIILLRNFAELEEQNTRLDVKRALAALFNELSILNSINSDWAGWDDTYAFIVDVNEDYINTNIVDDTFTTLKLNFMIFINSSGKIVFGKGFDLHNEEEIPIPKKLQEHLSKDSLLLRHPDTKSYIAGIVLLPEAPLLVTSRPILNSKDEGPIRGTLIMGRYLDSNEIERLARITQLSLTVFRYNDPQVPPDFQVAHSLLSEKSPIIVKPLNKHSIGGYALIKDIYGNPAITLRVDKPREIYKQGKSTIIYFILLFLAVGLMFGLTTIFILEKLVISRMIQLSKNIISITTL